MNTLLRKILIPAAIFIASLTVLMFGDAAMRDFSARIVGKTLDFLPYAVGIVTWLSAAFLANRVINFVFWEGVVTKATGTPTPRLIVQISSFLIYLLAVTGIVGVVFERSVTALLTTSGAMGIVLGFAVRSLILDVFSGLSINIERPFVVGEYVQIHVRGVNNVFGRVEEVNWRTTRLLTPERYIQVIPNSVLGSAVISNFSRPSPIGEFEYVLTLDAAVDTERALRVLEAGLREAILAGGPLAEPEPAVRTTGVNEHGVRYKLKYFIDPRKGGPGKVRQTVLEHVMAHLRKAGISTAQAKYEVHQADLEERNLDHERDRLALLGRVELFQSMTEAELDTLSAQMSLQRFAKGAVVIEREQHLDSMFLLVEGVLETHVPVPDTDVMGVVGHYAPGDCFGEMSLLTGAPQTATVIAASEAVAFRIDKDDVSGLLQARPEIADELSARIAARSEQVEVRLGEISADLRRRKSETEKGQFIAHLAGQIRDFFKIGLVGNVAHLIHRLAGRDPHENVMRGTMAACALVAAVDGTIDDDERAYIRSVFGSIGLLEHLDEEAGMAVFDDCVGALAADPELGESQLLGYIKELASNPNAGRMVLSICHALSAADGTVDDDEIARIEQIAQALDLADDAEKNTKTTTDGTIEDAADFN